MKKIFIILTAMIFFMTFSTQAAMADRGYGHGGYGHGGHGYYHGHHGYGWDALAIGLGAAIVGTAILNSYPREHVTVVEHETYYRPDYSPQYRDHREYYPDSYSAPGRVWIPGQYLHEGGGRYVYVPGHWEE